MQVRLSHNGLLERRLLWPGARLILHTGGRLTEVEPWKQKKPGSRFPSRTWLSSF